MSVHDAEPGDIYVDGDGKLWRVLWTCQHPTVGVEAVEPNGVIPPPQDAINILTNLPMEPTWLRQRQQGAVNGLMWNGFKRIYRKEKT